jgi:cation:H+ antiporter
MNDHVELLLGILFAGLGGELFIRGAVGVGYWARIPAGIIGVTLAAFATSSPELSVSVSAALAGTPEIALGDALGSNVVNVALILALALVISGIQCSGASIRRDFPVALLIPVITGLLLWDGTLSRLDGVLLLGMFAVWLVLVVVEARKRQIAFDADRPAPRRARIVLACLFGLGFLFLAGRLIVAGAKGIASSFGIDEFVIGATIVAVGTSVPELATTVIAKFRGHDDVGLGTVLGSNIFNGLFIIGVAATIHPITVAWSAVAVALLFGVVALALTWPGGSGFIDRRRGVLLLVLYASYLALILFCGAE